MTQKEIKDKLLEMNNQYVIYRGAAFIAKDLFPILQEQEEILDICDARISSALKFLKGGKYVRCYLVVTSLRIIYIERGNMIMSAIPFTKKTIAFSKDNICAGLEKNNGIESVSYKYILRLQTNEGEYAIAVDKDISEELNCSQQQQSNGQALRQSSGTEKKSVKKGKKSIGAVVVAVIFVGVVAIGILMFSGDDTDDLALAYAQKASFYDCRTPLKDILEYYWDGGQWYVYTADETGHMVVEYAKDKDEKTKICFDVDVDDESIKPVEYTENDTVKINDEEQVDEKLWEMYVAYAKEYALDDTNFAYKFVNSTVTVNDTDDEIDKQADYQTESNEASSEVETESENFNGADDMQSEEANDYDEGYVTNEDIDSAWGYWGSYDREDGLSFSIFPIDTQTCYLSFGNEDGTIDVRDVEAVKTGDNTAECTSPNGAKLYLAIDWEFGTIIIQQNGYLDYCDGIDFSGTYQGDDSTYEGEE